MNFQYAMLETVRSMAPYDEFAWFYNRYWNEEFHSLAFPLLERIWLGRLPAGARILDVCCGTGYLAELLTQRGYKVTGVDLSPAMIAFARERAPEAEFHVADAARFQAPGEFEGAVSTFDSLNHILHPEDFEAALRNTAEALKPGGLLVFDMLLEEGYRTRWGEQFSLVRDDHVLTISGSGFDFRRHLASCTITMFRLVEGAWRRRDATIEERCYSRDEIEGALGRAGFGELSSYDAGALGMAGQLGAGRAFFLAVKR